MEKSKECRKGGPNCANCTKGKLGGCPCRCHNTAQRDQFLTVKAVKGAAKVVKKLKK